MGGTSIGYAGALLGGVATLLSPCAAMLLPAFFAYAFSSRRTLVARTALFYLGLLTTLVPLGIAAGGLGEVLLRRRELLLTTTAWVVIALGVVQALNLTRHLRLPGGLGSGGPSTDPDRDPASPLAVYLLGTSYGLAGGLCSGPILGAILSVASFQGDTVTGGLLLATYAAGMALPLLVLALAWDRLGVSRRAWLRPRPVLLGPVQTTVMNLLSGLLFIAIGVLMLLTDGATTAGSVLSPDRQVALEHDLASWAADIPDGVVIALVMAAIAGSYVVWSRRRSH